MKNEKKYLFVILVIALLFVFKNNIAAATPVAEFSVARSGDLVPLTVNFTDLSTGDTESRVWHFGDGNTSLEQNPTHTYEKTGIYTVSLTVSDKDGSDTEIKSDFIIAKGGETPVADFDVEPKVGVAPMKVFYENLSTTMVDTWAYNFGNGFLCNLQYPAVTYENPGTYTISLQVSGPEGSNKSIKKDLFVVKEGDDSVKALFSAEPVLGSIPFTVHFIDQSNGNVNDWTWNFGDGNSLSGEQNPVHTYNEAGNFTVELIVTGESGSDSHVREDFITVNEDDLPTAAFTASPRFGLQSLEAQFQDLSSIVFEGDSPSDDPSVSWHWDFGDGSESTEQNPTHSYSSESTKGFTVSLLVKDRRGTDLISKRSFIGVRTLLPGVVKGTVLNRETNLPLVGAKAFFRQFGMFQRTDESGAFLFELLPGTYGLCAESNNFETGCEEKLIVESSEVFTRNFALKPLDPESSEIIEASIVIKPETISLSKTKKFRAFIQLTNGRDVNDIIESSIVCVNASAVKTRISRTNRIIAVFNVQDLVDIETGEDVEIGFSGNLTNGDSFEGLDFIDVTE